MQHTDFASDAVETPFGVVVGKREGQVVRFAGVPYAAPPVGQRRFRLPEPPAPRAEPLDCRGAGSIPPQLPSRLAKVMGDYPAAQDEDCLHLDIWVPAERNAKTAVLVFLHGGAFMTGGGSLPCYDGGKLAASTGMIVVNVSYRLGVLGFLAIPGVAPANLGLHDQIAALRWIKEAIPSFGGDADTITIAGQSAGALSIALLLAMPSARGLFKRAVMMSAPLGLALPTADEQSRLGGKLMGQLGLAEGDLAGAQVLPTSRILEAQLALLRLGGGTPGDVSPPFVPAIDNKLVTVEPNQALAESALDHDLMIGTTREEMAAFYYGDEALESMADAAAEAAFTRHFGDAADEMMRKARSRRVPSTAIAILGDLNGDILFGAPSREFARVQATLGGSPYVYQFDWQSPTRGIEACHCIELPFLFGNVETWREAPMLVSADWREVADLSRIFQGAIGAFAKTGMPAGADLPDWPSYGETHAIQHFDRTIMATAAA